MGVNRVSTRISSSPSAPSPVGLGGLAHSHPTTSSTMSSILAVGGVDDPGPVGHAQG